MSLVRLHEQLEHNSRPIYQSCDLLKREAAPEHSVLADQSAFARAELIAEEDVVRVEEGVAYRVVEEPVEDFLDVLEACLDAPL